MDICKAREWALKVKEKEYNNLVTKAHHLKGHIEAFEVLGFHPQHPEGEPLSKKAKGKSRAKTQAPPFYFPEGTSKLRPTLIPHCLCETTQRLVHPEG
jgi:hypothetical protein